MRIGLLTHAVEGGGAQQVARGWATALAGLGHDVTMIVLDALPQEPEPERPWRVLHLRARGVRTIPRRVTAMRHAIDSGRFDALVALQTYPNLLALVSQLGSARRVPTIISEHNVPSVYLRQGPSSYRAQLLLARLLYRRADSVIAVSHAVATDLIANFRVRGDRSTVLMNTIFSSGPSQPALDEPAPGPRVRLLVAARLARQKRPWKAVSIAECLHQHGIRAELIWVGDPSGDLDPGEVPGSASVPIEFLPWRDDWLALADDRTVVLLPSDVEGLGNVLVEAAAAGVPSVASSSALGVADAIIPGVTGALALSDDTESFASAVLQAMQLERRPAPAAWLRQFHAEPAAAAFSSMLSRSTRRSRGIVGRR